MPAYHATTPGEDFAAREARAQGQQNRVLDYMRSAPVARTAWQVWDHFHDMHVNSGTPDIDIGSVRRSLSNLKNDKKLIRHSTLYRTGPKGATETFYQFNAGQMA